MKAFLIIILTLSAQYAWSQDEVNVNSISDFNRVQIGISISPDICFRTLRNNDGSTTSDQIIALRNDNEIFKFGYTTGLNIGYSINSFFGLEMGIHYSNKGYQSKMIDLVFSQPEPSLPEQFKYIDNFHFVDVPFKANFTLGKKRVRFFTSVGVTTNFFIKATTTSVMVYADREDRKTSSSNYEYAKVNFSPTFSAGIDFKINNSMNLRFEPTIRYGMMKIIDTPITAYLYNAGLNVSYYYSF